MNYIGPLYGLSTEEIEFIKKLQALIAARADLQSDRSEYKHLLLDLRSLATAGTQECDFADYSSALCDACVTKWSKKSLYSQQRLVLKWAVTYLLSYNSKVAVHGRLRAATETRFVYLFSHWAVLRAMFSRSCSR